MYPSSRARSASLLVVLALALAMLPGCDGDNVQREPPPPPEDGAEVRTFEVDFDVAEADRAGAVRSIAYEAPELTREVVERGVVMAYLRTQNAFDETVWRALPYSYGVEFEDTDSTEAAVDYTVTLGYAFDVDLFEVSYELSANDSFVWRQLEERSPHRIRVVAFTEGAVGRAQSLDLTNYEAVERRFDLNP